MDFYIPQYKYQLVAWLERYDSSINWNLKRKKQLMAIYITIQKKGGMINEIQTKSTDYPNGPVIIKRCILYSNGLSY